MRGGTQNVLELSKNECVVSVNDNDAFIALGALKTPIAVVGLVSCGALIAAIALVACTHVPLLSMYPHLMDII